MSFSPNNVDRALESLSDIIRVFQDVEVDAEPSKELVDATALLNRRLSELNKLNEKLKGVIKGHLVDHEETIRQGTVFEAVLERFQKAYWKTEELKTFLGAHLDSMRYTNNEVRLNFRPKT